MALVTTLNIGDSVLIGGQEFSLIGSSPKGVATIHDKEEAKKIILTANSAHDLSDEVSLICCGSPKSGKIKLAIEAPRDITVSIVRRAAYL